MKSLTSILVWIFAAVWAACVLYGFIAFQETTPTGSGFTRGYNRLEAFFSWQLYALGAATIGFVIGHMSSATGIAKLAGRWPLFLSAGFFLLVIILFVGAILWARLSGQ